jgi:hypothetical protein
VADKQEPKKVPPRNNLAQATLRKQSRSNELSGRDPDFHYEYFYAGENPAHPGHVSRKLQEHEHGTSMGGYVDVAPWQVVHSQTDRKVGQADPREDQGKPIDTTVRRGHQVLCRIHKDEYAKYGLADHADTEARSKAYKDPDRMRRPGSAMTVAISDDEHADHMEMLADSGHPMPGYQRQQEKR